jgi:hypothetical protein
MDITSPPATRTVTLTDIDLRMEGGVLLPLNTLALTHHRSMVTPRLF